MPYSLYVVDSRMKMFRGSFEKRVSFIVVVSLNVILTAIRFWNTSNHFE